MTGNGIERNALEAAKYVKLSADQGRDYGRTNSGLCLLFGIGVERNDGNAADYFTLSAAAGYPLGQYPYSHVLGHGTGFPRTWKSRSDIAFDGAFDRKEYQKLLDRIGIPEQFEAAMRTSLFISELRIDFDSLIHLRNLVMEDSAPR